MKLPYLQSIVTGILIGTSYIPFPPWAIFFCFVPLWNSWLTEKSAKRVFISGWISQFVLTLIGFNWVAYTVHEFGHLPWPAAILCLLAFCSFAHLHIPLAGLAWHYFGRFFKLNEKEKIWALPLFLSLGERLFPMIFDWHFGYTWLWARFPAYQLADTVGFLGLSTIGLVFNAFILQAYLAHSRRRRWLPWLATPVLAFALLNLAGWWKSLSPQPTDAKAHVLVVQANIGNQEKLGAIAGTNFRDIVFDRFSDLTTQGLATGPRADFIVWPETAFPEIIHDPNLSYGFSARLRQAVSAWGTKLITGGYTVIESTNQITNSFFVLDEKGAWMAQPYHKSILLAFGEYFPFADWFPILRVKFPEVGNFFRGPGPTVIDAAGIRIGAQICYESLFDWFSRDLARQGAHILVNLTNDSWYGKWMEPYQHGWMTLARAVEVRRPLVRSTNTGISAVILANGEILKPSPLHEEWFQLYEIPYALNPPTTPFMGWGFWLIPALITMGLIGTIWSARRRTS